MFESEQKESNKAIKEKEISQKYEEGWVSYLLKLFLDYSDESDDLPS